MVVQPFYFMIEGFGLRLIAKLNCLPEEAYQFAFRRFSANLKDFSRRQKEQFCHILHQVARAHQGIGTPEMAILKRIRIDLGRLTLFSQEPWPAVKHVQGPTR
jgi:hypothetical protein